MHRFDDEDEDVAIEEPVEDFSLPKDESEELENEFDGDLQLGVLTRKERKKLITNLENVMVSALAVGGRVQGPTAVEFFSRPRLALYGARYGIQVVASKDLTNGWDALTKDGRQEMLDILH